MSIDVGYFFNSELSLAELVQRINQVIGTSLEPYEGNPLDLFCRFMSLETSLSEHSLVNDQDLDFGTYRYVFNMRSTAGSVDLVDVQLGAMAMVPFILQRRADIDAGILVYNIQNLLCRYKLHEERFIDASNGREAIFHTHLQDVLARIHRYID